MVLEARDRDAGARAHRTRQLDFDRVYYWGALAGKRRGSRFDPELLCAGAMFRDVGLTHRPPAPGVVSITSAAIRAVAGRGPLGPMKKYWSLLNVG